MPTSLHITPNNQQGELTFERLLRVDGRFEGTLISKGNLVVGPKGSVTGDITNLKHVTVLGGKINGNISVETLVLKGAAKVIGNIIC
eukprot:12234-Heterococcus_DN1.PRE.5